MTDKAIPTITLAELYENQNQHIDALVIYKNLCKENPTEELQNKIDELKDKIFNENTLEYSTIIDKIFTAEEKRFFHILPHEQYKVYTESQAEMKNEETYPEELTEVKEGEVAHEEVVPDEIEKPETEEDTPEIDNTLEPDIEVEEEDSIEEKKEKLTFEDEKIPEIDEEESDDIGNELEPEEEIKEEETIEIDDELEDDISIDIDEDVSEELEENETKHEPKNNLDDDASFDDLMENLTEKENDVVDTEETDKSEESKDELEPVLESQDKNQILNLLTTLSKLRPDIVERVLKENVGPDTSLSEIKLSDLNFVVELLKVSENVKKD